MCVAPKAHTRVLALTLVTLAAARDAAAKGLFHVDVALDNTWFLDKTNQRDLRCVTSCGERTMLAF